MNAEMVGEDISGIPGLTPDLFIKDISEPFVKHIVEDQKNYLIGVNQQGFHPMRSECFFILLRRALNSQFDIFTLPIFI